MSDQKKQAEQNVQESPNKGDASANSVPATGRRLAFQDIKRELSDQDLANPGTQKLILEMLLSAESERDELKGAVIKFHEADKLSAILGEKLKTNKVNEVLFGVGVGLGGAIVGLAPLFWGQDSKGPIVLAVGALLIVGSTIGRIVFK